MTAVDKGNKPQFINALRRWLIASLLILAAVMLPPGGGLDTVAPVNMDSPYSGSMDALVTGTGDGLRLLANIIGMLIVFVALVYLVDRGLGLIPTGGEPLTLVGVFGALALGGQGHVNGHVATAYNGNPAFQIGVLMLHQRFAVGLDFRVDLAFLQIHRMEDATGEPDVLRRQPQHREPPIHRNGGLNR